MLGECLKHVELSCNKAKYHCCILLDNCFYKLSNVRYWQCFLLLSYILIGKFWKTTFNTLNEELNPICHFVSLLGAHSVLHVSR
jgi:hypothetical protein